MTLIASALRLMEKLAVALCRNIPDDGEHIQPKLAEGISIRSLGFYYEENQPVLLIDEATASLDNETSFEALDSILNLDGYTRIVVTHDLDENILRRCTGVFTLKKGEICEQGTFDELMDKKGYFYSLFTVSQK